MIEIDIPSIDPIQHKPKVFMGMTSRQILCIVPAVALAGTLFALTCSFSMDLAVILAGICVVPAICLGWITPYNMKFEDYAKLVYFNMFVSNPKRIYKTDSAETHKALTIKEREELERMKLASEKKKKASKNSKSSKSKKDKTGEIKINESED